MNKDKLIKHLELIFFTKGIDISEGKINVLLGLIESRNADDTVSTNIINREAIANRYNLSTAGVENIKRKLEKDGVIERQTRGMYNFTREINELFNYENEMNVDILLGIDDNNVNIKKYIIDDKKI